MSLNQPLLLSSALVHQVLLSPTTYLYKQVNVREAAQPTLWLKRHESQTSSFRPFKGAGEGAEGCVGVL